MRPGSYDGWYRVANRLAVLARAVSLAHSDSGPHSCPLVSGGVTVIAFRYPRGANIALWFLPGACGHLSNGAIVADSFINPSSGDFQLAIQALTG